MNTTGVHATAIIGSTFPGQIVSDIISLATGASTFIDTSANVEVMLKETILDPIANQLISSVIEESSDNITSWVTGGFDGAPSLITGNPEDFIKKAGLNAARGALGNIPEDSVFGDSLFATLKDTYSGANDLKAQIEGLSKSDIPEEVIYFQTRWENYKALMWTVFFINFAFPMVMLMSRDSKRNFFGAREIIRQSKS